MKLTLTTLMKINEETVMPTLYSQGFIYIGIIKPTRQEDMWDIETWSDICEFKEMMIKRGQEYSGIKVRELYGKSEIYDWLKE